MSLKFGEGGFLCRWLVVFDIVEFKCLDVVRSKVVYVGWVEIVNWGFVWIVCGFCVEDVLICCDEVFGVYRELGLVGVVCNYFWIILLM